MQNTSALYDSIVSSENHWFEVSLAIGESGRLVTENNEVIKFGSTAILVHTGGALSGFREDVLISLETVIGSAVSGQISVKMIMPTATIPKRARLAPYIRATDGVRYSEWLPKGIYYIDTREVTQTLPLFFYKSLDCGCVRHH